MSEPKILELQKEIEGFELFKSNEGKSNEILLSENPENFKRLRFTIIRGNSIGAQDGGVGRSTIEVDISTLAEGIYNVLHPTLFINDTDGDAVIFYACRAIITKGSKTIELANNSKRYYISNDGTAVEEMTSIAICKIVGFKS